MFASSVMLVGCSSQTAAQPSAGPVDKAPSGNQTEYEWAVALSKCLITDGWDAEVDPQGGWGVVAQVPEDQRSVYDAAYAACMDDTGIASFEVTAETAKASWENNVRVTKCLSDEGYAVSEAPKVDAFVQDTLDAPEEMVWDPYALIPPDDVAQAVLDCPQ